MQDLAASSPPAELLRSVRQLLDESDRWRRRTLNLIASENVLSPAARSVLDSDFLHRYAEGHPGFRYYEGTRYVDEVERLAQEVMCRIFRTGWADVRPISGTVSNEAVFSRLVPQGAAAIAHTIATGGHISHARIGSLGKRTKNISPWPMEENGYRIDVAAAQDMLREQKPHMAVVGRSLFLFPEPVAELSEVCRETGTLLFYDGAHVLGLIAAGRFQDPLREGADVMAGSTHKTFFGPQRGVVLTKGDDEKLNRNLDKGVFPGSSSNHHLFSLPSLLVAGLEMEAFGAEYADATIANAKALAGSLAKRGLPVAGEAHGYTESHQVAVDVSAFGGGKEVSARLCSQDVICNMNMLPGEPPKAALDPKGIRLGVQEMTRNGMGPAEMDVVAELIQTVCNKGHDIREEVGALRDKFADVKYGYGVEDLQG